MTAAQTENKVQIIGAGYEALDAFEWLMRARGLGWLDDAEAVAWHHIHVTGDYLVANDGYRMHLLSRRVLEKRINYTLPDGVFHIVLDREEQRVLLEKRDLLYKDHLPALADHRESDTVKSAVLNADFLIQALTGMHEATVSVRGGSFPAMICGEVGLVPATALIMPIRVGKGESA